MLYSEFLCLEGQTTMTDKKVVYVKNRDLTINHLGLSTIELKGMHLNHNFYVVVGKQCRTENA